MSEPQQLPPVADAPTLAPAADVVADQPAVPSASSSSPTSSDTPVVVETASSSQTSTPTNPPSALPVSSPHTAPDWVPSSNAASSVVLASSTASLLPAAAPTPTTSAPALSCTKKQTDIEKRSGRADSMSSTASTGSSISSAGSSGDELTYKRKDAWRKHFKTQESEELLDTCGCAYIADIMIHGRLYVSDRQIYFRSSILGIKTKKVIALADITAVIPQKVALLIPNALEIVHKNGEESKFCTMTKRDATLEVIRSSWKAAKPQAYAAFVATENGDDESDSTASDNKGLTEAEVAKKRTSGDVGHGGEVTPNANGGKTAVAGRPRAATNADTPKYEQIALDTRLATTPEKAFNLMYKDSEFIKALWEGQGCRDIQIGEWQGKEREMQYVKPIGGNIGQAKCVFTEKILNDDPQTWLGIQGTTQTPDVPSGKSFIVRTKTVFTWAGGKKGGTRMVASFQIDWSGRSMLKSIINSSSVSGQKEWNNLLATKIREKIETEPEKYALTPEESGRGVASGEAVGVTSASGDVPFENGNGPHDGEGDDEDDDCSTLRGGEAPSGGTMEDVFDWLGEDVVRSALIILLLISVCIHLRNMLISGRAAKRIATQATEAATRAVLARAEAVGYSEGGGSSSMTAGEVDVNALLKAQTQCIRACLKDASV